MKDHRAPYTSRREGGNGSRRHRQSPPQSPAHRDNRSERSSHRTVRSHHHASHSGHSQKLAGAEPSKADNSTRRVWEETLRRQYFRSKRFRAVDDGFRQGLRTCKLQT